MEEAKKDISLIYERIEKELASMRGAIDAFEEENTDFFSNEIDMLNQMNSNYVEQQRQMLECFTHRLGNTLIDNMESCYQDVVDAFIHIKETDEATNKILKERE